MTKKTPIAIEAISSDKPDEMKELLREVYHDVLKPCFEEIGAPIEKEGTLLNLANVNSCNPDAKFHVITARVQGNIAGTTCFSTSAVNNTAFWVYEGVKKELRRLKIATAIHEYMDQYLGNFFSGRPYALFLELSNVDRNKLYEKLESLGARELAIDYRDALGDPRWALCVRISGAGSHVGSITKREVYTLLKETRELALLKRFNSPEEEANDPIMQFHKESLEKIVGEEVPIHETPIRYARKAHRKTSAGRTCSDSL